MTFHSPASVPGQAPVRWRERDGNDRVILHSTCVSQRVVRGVCSTGCTGRDSHAQNRIAGSLKDEVHVRQVNAHQLLLDAC